MLKFYSKNRTTKESCMALLRIILKLKYNPNLSNRITEVNLQEINDNGNVKVKLINENSFKFKLA